MKIAFLVGKFPVLSESFILNQIAGLLDRGHEVDIYAIDGPADNNGTKVHPIVTKYNLSERTYFSPVPPEDKADLTPNEDKFISQIFQRNPEACQNLIDVAKHEKQVLNKKLSQKQLTNQALAFSNYSIDRS